jgi:hypothetical protein
MYLGKLLEDEIANRFEGTLDEIPALDPVKFYLKREAAEAAAKTVIAFLRSVKRRTP